MHVQSIRLKYFKRFRDSGNKFDFTDPETGLARPLVVLVGENGSGKSTVLQAIAATLGTATRRFDRPEDLQWPGFDLMLAGAAYRLPYEVNLKVGFRPAECEATVDYFNKIPGFQEHPGMMAPSKDLAVNLTLREGQVRAVTGAQYFQFRGREYAKQVVKFADEGYRVFENVGTLFWYTEHRTSTSLTAEVVIPERNGESTREAGTQVGGHLHFDQDLLRRRLADLMSFHSRVERGEYKLRPGQRDIFAYLESAYRKIFPSRRFDGPVPRTDVDEVLLEPWFYLTDDQNHQYEISEMSGGERAIFPLLFDFANWQINNSVILVDELELHLHPPLQQAFLRALPELGKNNQFIITTHSDWIAKLVPNHCVYRVE